MAVSDRGLPTGSWSGSASGGIRALRPPRRARSPLGASGTRPQRGVGTCAARSGYLWSQTAVGVAATVRKAGAR